MDVVTPFLDTLCFFCVLRVPRGQMTEFVLHLDDEALALADAAADRA
jgi:hypothetical protein